MSQKKLNEKLEKAFRGIWIPKNIWLSDELTPIQMLVLMEIDSLDNDFGCTASNQDLASFFGVDKDTIQYHIRNLQTLDFINISYRNNTPSDGGRVIRMSRKFKLLTAGLLEELEDYKNVKASNTPTEEIQGGGEKIPKGGEELHGGGEKIPTHSNTYSSTFSISSSSKNISDAGENLQEEMTQKIQEIKKSVEAHHMYPTFKDQTLEKIDEKTFNYNLDLAICTLIDKKSNTNPFMFVKTYFGYELENLIKTQILTKKAKYYDNKKPNEYPNWSQKPAKKDNITKQQAVEMFDQDYQTVAPF